MHIPFEFESVHTCLHLLTYLHSFINIMEAFYMHVLFESIHVHPARPKGPR